MVISADAEVVSACGARRDLKSKPMPRSLPIMSILLKLTAFALVMGFSPALGQTSEFPKISDLDSAELFTRPGIADYGFPVGALWLCLSKAPTGQTQISAISNDPEKTIVRVQFASGKSMLFFFRRLGDAALLYRMEGSDGSITQDIGEIKMVVIQLVGACSPK